MTPAQLDLIANGAFIYVRADGSRYASFDYKLRDWGVECVGRSGKLTADDLQKTQETLLREISESLAA